MLAAPDYDLDMGLSTFNMTLVLWHAAGKAMTRNAGAIVGQIGR